MKFFLSTAFLLSATLVAAAPYPAGPEDNHRHKIVSDLTKTHEGEGAAKKNEIFDVLRNEPIHTGNPGINVVGNKKVHARAPEPTKQPNKIVSDFSKKHEGEGAARKNEIFDVLRNEPLHTGNPGINVIGNKKVHARAPEPTRQPNKIVSDFSKTHEGEGAARKNEVFEVLRNEPLHTGNPGIKVVGNKVAPRDAPEPTKTQAPGQRGRWVF